MHAYLIVGTTENEREKFALDFASKSGITEIHKLYTEKDKHHIADIRNLIHNLRISPLDAEKGRAVIIFEANKLTIESANAFLKTLEDPPGNTLIILTSPERDLVPDTISSRTLILNSGTKRVEYEQKEIQKATETLSKLLESSIGDKLNFLEKIADREDGIKFCDLQIYALRELLLKNPSLACVELVERTQKAKEDLEANVNVKLVLGDLLLNF